MNKMTNLRTLNPTKENPGKNPFEDIMTQQQFEHILKEGFEKGKLDCYADLQYGRNRELCFVKTIYDRVTVNIYITKDGIAIDKDYDCGGNIDNQTLWFENGTFYHLEDERDYNKQQWRFEDAYNDMVEKVMNYLD